MGDELVSEDDRPLHEAWGWYFMARTANLRGDSAQALEHLDQVPDPAALDLLYATWHWAERAGALWQLNRFDEAFAALDSEIAIHESDHPDDANIVTPWLGRARLCGQLWRQREQVDAARRAVDTADMRGSPSPTRCVTTETLQARCCRPCTVWPWRVALSVTRWTPNRCS
jgi:tetratricopeptide (TPR) repeat protein